MLDNFATVEEAVSFINEDTFQVVSDKMPDGSRSVSYTHLDVYKRQRKIHLIFFYSSEHKDSNKSYYKLLIIICLPKALFEAFSVIFRQTTINKWGKIRNIKKLILSMIDIIFLKVLDALIVM